LFCERQLHPTRWGWPAISKGTTTTTQPVIQGFPKKSPFAADPARRDTPFVSQFQQHVFGHSEVCRGLGQREDFLKSRLAARWGLRYCHRNSYPPRRLIAEIFPLHAFSRT